MPDDLPEKMLRQLIPANVRGYALRAGWTAVPNVKRPVILLNHPTDDLVQVQIPTAGDDRDYTFLMRETVGTLAASEQRPPRAVLADLSVPQADVLRWAVHSSEADAGALPLGEGIKLLAGGRDALLAAACSVRHRQAYFPSQTFTQAVAFLDHCRMGHTESTSSYVATILAPVPPEGTLFDAPEVEPSVETEPFDRQVTLLLMQALQLLRISLDGGGKLDLKAAIDKGVSANLCDALAGMAPADEHATVSVRVSWSRTRPRVPKTVPQLVTFAQPEFAALRAAAQQLKAVKTGRARVEGLLESVKADLTQTPDDFSGEVTIRDTAGGPTPKLKFRLRGADFQQACDALKRRSRVSVTGIVVSTAQSRVSNLIQPTDFRVLSQVGVLGNGTPT